MRRNVVVSGIWEACQRPQLQQEGGNRTTGKSELSIPHLSCMASESNVSATQSLLPNESGQERWLGRTKT